MTWQTPDGDRKLTGAEADLVRHLLGMMADMLLDNFAYREKGFQGWDFGVTLFDEEYPLPTADCDDLSEWVWLVDRLADQILWDRDFEMADSFLDSDPERTGLLKQALGIDSDYYWSIPADATQENIEQLVAEVRALAADLPDDLDIQF